MKAFDFSFLLLRLDGLLFRGCGFFVLFWDPFGPFVEVEEEEPLSCCCCCRRAFVLWPFGLDVAALPSEDSSSRLTEGNCIGLALYLREETSMREDFAVVVKPSTQFIIMAAATTTA